MPVSSTLNQIVQLGVETVPGTPAGGGSNRLLRHLTYNIDPQFDYQMYRGGGRRFNSVQTLKGDWAKFKIGGPISYTELAYPFAGLWGLPTVTTPANGVNARQLAWSPKLTGAQGGVTYQGQNGDSVRTRQFNWMTQTGLELSIKRSGDSTVSGGDGFAAATQPNATPTAAPTSQLQVPAPPVNFNLFMDSTSTNIGVSLIAQCVEAQFKTSGWNAPIWFLVRGNNSYGATVDTPPAVTMLLRMVPDSAVDALWFAARANATYYIRLDGVGNPVDNQYSLNGSASYTSGNFVLTYKGVASATIAFNALGSTIQSTLNAMSSIGALGVTVAPSGSAFNTANTFTITFNGPLANDPSLLVANFGALVGGSPVLTNLSVSNNLRIDMAAKIVPQGFNDDSGAWIQDWLFEIVEDAAWTEAGASGTALYAQLINNMTGL